MTNKACAADQTLTSGEAVELYDAHKALRDGYADAVGGLRYIEQEFGRLAGVGWDRVFDHYDDWVKIPEREGLLAGSHVLPTPGAI